MPFLFYTEISVEYGQLCFGPKVKGKNPNNIYGEELEIVFSSKTIIILKSKHNDKAR